MGCYPTVEFGTESARLGLESLRITDTGTG